MDEKIRVAKDLLVNTVWTMSDIARELGYCDTAHFGKSFKQSSGVSPIQYRQSQQDKLKV